MRVTLIMPSLNGARFLPEALDSVLCQMDDDLELVVADGGSTDSTHAMLRGLPGVKLLAGTDASSHEGINKALAAAAGDVIGFLNTDDVISATAVAEVRAAFDRALAAMAIYSPALFFEEADDGARRFNSLWGAPPPDLLLPALLLGVTCFNAWFFRREAFVRFGALDAGLDFSADREFLVRIARSATVQMIAAPLYAYRMHSRSRTMSGNVENILAYVGEHIGFGMAMLRSSELLARERQLVREFVAFEHGRRALYEWRSGRRLQAIVRLGRHALGSPLWPFQFAASLKRRRAVYRAMLDGHPEPATFAGFPVMKRAARS